jgi:hypothetical protein
MAGPRSWRTNVNAEPDTKALGVPFTRFFLAIGIQLVAMLGVVSLVAPATFRDEINRPWLILMWTGLLGLPLSLFEYFYHRYLLHSAVLPFMASMHRAHSTHHGLTYIKAPVSPQVPAKLVPVKSKFPIEEDHQEESMMFPLYSLPIFVAVFMILLGIPLKLMMPAQPILLALIFAVTLYLIAYEVWHAVLHLPFERFWQPLLSGRWTGKVAKRMYSFHLMHHWRPSSTLAIVGFWGVAIWDYAFLTHRRPERMPLDGSEVSYDDAKLRKPLWPIGLFDRWQVGLYRVSRSVERFLARIFLRRT